MAQKLFTRNFILLILGQISSLFGNFILKLALSMYVLEKTGSASVFAGILSVATLPSILLSPFGGVLADRADKRKIMVSLDALTGICVLSAALFLSANHGLAIIGMLLIALSVLGAFETPTVQACIPTMLSGDNITKGNAVVNQVASLSYLTAPMLGGILYTAFGLLPVMYASILCFFLTAALECFIVLPTGNQSTDHMPTGPLTTKQPISAAIKQDFQDSIHYMVKEQPDIFKMLSLTALSRFFVMGVTLVGLPFIIRTILHLNARYYGAAESALAIATICGSVLAALLSKKLKIHNLALLLASLGIFILPAGCVFLLPCSITVKYIVIIFSFCGMQAAISIFSIFAVSLIQQRTPNHFIGKIMAYTATITLCAQPIGQLVYGFLFDRFRYAVHFVLLPSGIIICLIGLSASKFFDAQEP